MNAKWFWSVVVLCAVLATPLAADPQSPVGSAFTYQGQLKQGGLPVYDTADIQFTLWDALAGGSQIDGIVPVNNQLVSNGLFTVSLDFGAAAFNGQARWLQIAVRVPAGGGAFTTLSPRQPLTPAPYALYVDNADKVDGYHAGNSAGQVPVSNGTVSTSLNADQLDGYHAGNSSGQVPVSNGTVCTNLNADMVNGTHGPCLRLLASGTVDAGTSATLIIPHWYNWTLQLSCGWPDAGGLCLVQGFENDDYIGVVYMKYNGDGTSGMGGAEGWEGSTTTLVSFGSGSYVYTVRCPGEAAGDHNIVLSAPGSGVELRYSLTTDHPGP